MTLIVEDGTGLSTAESYISVADADAYHTSRGNTGWTGTEAAKEAALRRSTDWMVATYRNGWKGVRCASTQALDWPRYDVELNDVSGGPTSYLLPSNEVPLEVRRACAEMALRALTTNLRPDQGRIQKSATVGPVSVVYDEFGPSQTSYGAVNAMLAHLMGQTGMGGMIRIARG